jgi:hypothetical protein
MAAPSLSRREYVRRSAVEGQCFYCGVVADTEDHVPPRTVRPILLAEGLADRYPFIEVPCCRECNSVLGARCVWTLPERKRFIKKALRRRYRKWLAVPDWSESEIGRLGPMLQRAVLHGLAMRDLTLERLRF